MRPKDAKTKTGVDGHHGRSLRRGADTGLLNSSSR
jgi:hypothetical protein